MKKLTEVTRVKRNDIPSIRTIEVNGVEHWLGHVKDFIKQPHLLNFLPDDKRVSMAWVRLEAEEELEPHTHPVESMILLCEGRARTDGNRTVGHYLVARVNLSNDGFSNSTLVA